MSVSYDFKFLVVGFIAICAPTAVSVSSPSERRSLRSASLLQLDRGDGGSQQLRNVWVNCDSDSRDSCTIGTDEIANATARARYNISVNATTGFAALDVRHGSITNASRLNITAYAMGYAEGYLTAAEIADFYPNVYEFGAEGPSAELVDFVKNNDAWVRSKVDSNKAGSAHYEYWHQVGLILSRFDGILDGYAEAAPAKNLPNMSYTQLLWMNLDGDLFDLQEAIPSSEVIMRRNTIEPLVSPRDLRLKRLRGFRCSALFKLADDNSDIFFGHTTWDTYATAAPRIFKSLELPVLRGGEIKSRAMSFTSSPGFLGSLDDWYELSEGGDSGASLVVVETSAEVYDNTAYEGVKPESALCWIRMLVANALATSAPGWTDLFKIAASGTYNNQWMVLDVNKFTPGSPPPANTFWVLEEVPGKVIAKDTTDTLVSNGYWGSYNVLAFSQTREITGEMESYEDCERAQIFKDLQSDITSIDELKKVIGWNDFKPGSSSDPMKAIMARGDLLSMPYAVGGIDAKVSSAAVLKTGSLVSYVRAGPTTNNQSAFCWPLANDDTPHVGHPTCFNFGWGVYAPVEDL